MEVDTFFLWVTSLGVKNSKRLRLYCLNSMMFLQLLLSGCHGGFFYKNVQNEKNKQTDKSLVFFRRVSYQWTCLAHFPHLQSFSHLTPPCLPSFLLFPTVFLSVSCLESRSAGQPTVHKFVSGGAVEREAACSGGSGASTPTWGLFLAAEHGCCFRHVLFRTTTSLGTCRGPLDYCFSWWQGLVFFFLFCLFVLYRRWSGNTLIIHWF